MLVMDGIKEFEFNEHGLQKLKELPKDDMSCYDLLVQNGEYDILIENHKYIWNLTNESWVTRQDSHCTIGCIHTTQGYDMNYVGVIFGKEIDYDFNSNSIVIDLENYKDSKVKAGTDKETLKERTSCRLLSKHR